MSEQNLHKLPQIIAIANQKGGVGKTTTTINLASALAALEKKVLIVDIDPQGNASTGLGIDRNTRNVTAYDVILGDATLQDAMIKTGVLNLAIIPATTDLSSADLELISNEKRSFLLRDVLHQPHNEEIDVDYVLIDCPPSLNLLTVNALVAAHTLIVPLQAEFFALEGLSQLMLTLREVREAANPDLRIGGVLLTMVDSRNNLARQVEEDARATLGELVFKTVIPRNVRLSEAPSFSLPINAYDPASAGAKAYDALAKELIGLHTRNAQESSDG